MDFNERTKKLEYLLEIIEKGRCISIHQIALKFNCSKRTVKRMIAELRNQGYEINYCKSVKKFLLIH